MYAMILYSDIKMNDYINDIIKLHNNSLLWLALDLRGRV